MTIDAASKHSLDDIFAMWEKDAEIQQNDLANASTRTSALHHKYAKMLAAARLAHKMREMKYKELYRDKWEWVTGIIAPETLDQYGWEPLRKKILRADASVYLESDPDLQKLLIRLAESQERVDALESIIKIINGRAFQIKNAVDYLKFIHGGQ